MANQETSLTASNIKYLLVMYDLCKTAGETRCIRVAEVLGLSKPSVHTMINTLKDIKLLSPARVVEHCSMIICSDIGHLL